MDGALDQGHQRNQSACELGLGAHPLGEMEGLVEGLVENAPEQARLVGELVSFLGLAGDLRLANHHRVEGGGDAEEMADRGAAEVDVEVVVLGELAGAAGEVGQTAAEVEEQGVGVNAVLASEIELHTVAGPEVDQLGESRKVGELHQVLRREVAWQSRRRELINVYGTVTGADDTDSIHSFEPPGMDSTRDRISYQSPTRKRTLAQIFTGHLRIFSDQSRLRSTRRAGELEPPHRQTRKGWYRPMSSEIGFYWSTLGKKVLMAVTGIILFGFVAGHMLGNLQIYLGAEQLNHYGELLQANKPFLWAVRSVLLFCVGLHILAAVQVWLRNRAARPVKYKVFHPPGLDYAARTMVWSGPIIAVFIVFHLLDLTVGSANPDYVHGDVYHNVIASFSQPMVALVYIAANLLLGFHLYHGLWSLFQTFGWDHPRFGGLRRLFAIFFAVLIGAANISIPLAVLTGVIQ